jgi:predicted dienelactone hydrolase
MFETVLILVNIVSLFLSFKKQPKAVWAGAAGVNLLVLILHGAFEGLRYQMAFSYAYVILLVVRALAKTHDRFSEIKFPKLLRAITTGLTFGLLVFTSVLAYALPVFQLPEPTGNYDVGVQYFHLIDEDRTDPFLDTSTKKRELMVKVYYPAKKDDSKPFSPYFHSPALVKSFAVFYNLPGFAFDHLNLVRANSKEGLQLSDEAQTYPVILFSHGAGTTMEVQTSQSEDLASHGYIVVAIDHTYVSAATVFPDKITSHKDATTDFHIVEPAEIITQIMADDCSFVIDKLTEMSEGQMASIFKRRLDLEHIGAIGHSVGGAVAYNLALTDSRVKAAIDLDGVVFMTPPSQSAEMAPFLMLANDKYHIQSIRSRKPLMKQFEEMDEVEQKITVEILGSEAVYKEAYNHAQQNLLGLTAILEDSGNLFTIEGSDHMKFTDIGLFIGVSRMRELMGIGGKTDPARCLEITEAITLAFFEQHLKGRNGNALASLVGKYPELKKIDLR